MHPDADALRGLIEAVGAATGPDREIDAALWLRLIEKPRPGDKIDRDMVGRWPAYTASIDAAVALLDRVLPGFGYRLQLQPNGRLPVATLHAPPEAADASITDGRSWSRHYDGGGSTAPLAILGALLRAKLALLTQAEAVDADR